MSDYIQFLASICLTVITLVVMVGGCGTIIFITLAMWNMLKNERR